MFKTIGCIGYGNMGSALVDGCVTKLAPGQYNFCVYDRDQLRSKNCLEQIKFLADARTVVKQADLILLAVKPAQASDVLADITPELNSNKILLSIVAGYSKAKLQQAIQNKSPVVRCMPDTPAVVGKGVFAFSFAPEIASPDKKEILAIFGKLGVCLEIAEEKFAAFSSLIGAGPAYVFAMMQALVQAGATLGFTWQESKKMIEALFEGCAIMSREKNLHLTQLRDAVCSPAGLTIAGVNHLDRAGLTGLLVDAVLAAYQRSKEMED